MKIDLGALRGLDAHRQAYGDLAAHLKELEDEANGQVMAEDKLTDFNETFAERGRLEAAIEQLEIRDAAIKQTLQSPTTSESAAAAFPQQFNVRKSPDNVYDLAQYRQHANSVDELPGLYRDGAMRVLDRASFPTAKSSEQDAVKGHVEQLLAQHNDTGYGVLGKRSVLGRDIIATDDPVYREAFTQYIARGRDALAPRHLAVLQTYTDVDGGFAIPFTIDPTFIITTSGAASSLREYSRVETITTKSWHPITTEDDVASYGTETSATADSAPSDIDDLNGVTPLRAKRFIKFTAEYQEDYGAAAILAQVGVLIRDSKDLLEAEKFVQGTGSAEPEGIIWKLDDDGTSLVSVATFDLDGLDAVTAALGPRFRVGGRATYMANLAILQKVRQLGTAGAPANSIYDQISGILNGYPARELSFMDDAWSSGKEVLLFGDFKQFVIVDRIGLSMEYVPQVFDGSGDPLGQRGIYARWRNTSKVITVNAFRLLTHS
jgi:HK97 family phage major capsid protein